MTGSRGLVRARNAITFALATAGSILLAVGACDSDDDSSGPEAPVDTNPTEPADAGIEGSSAFDASASQVEADSSSGTVTTATSCTGAVGPGLTTCGPDGGESCCTSLPVPGGAFARNYDGVTWQDPGYPATVSGFRLDRFEVTVARFRRFVDAVVAGWRPTPGSGKHTHVHGGRGLVAAGDARTEHESGWDATWTAHLPTTRSAWASLACYPKYDTWTETPGPKEERPLTCVTWFEAYAFCIWDGGFLPSETEWNFAAAGGDEQRVYPWSQPPQDPTIDCAHANYGGESWPGTACDDAGPNDVGTESPTGDGKWGHADLAGNEFEWALDWYAVPVARQCVDCASLAPESSRVLRGGSYHTNAHYQSVAERQAYAPVAPTRADFSGIRCARLP